MSKAAQHFDLVGPTVDEDVQRIIRRYGPKAVREAVKQHTKGKRGVKPKPDWHDLDEILNQDAIRWLEGGDPFKERGNRAIARQIAISQPGQSEEAVYDRIRKKLIRDRRYYTLVQAAWLSESHYPYTAHLNTLKALVGRGRHTAWKAFLLNAEIAVADYIAKYGSPPLHITMREVADAAAAPLNAEPSKADGNILQVLRAGGRE